MLRTKLEPIPLYHASSVNKVVNGTDREYCAVLNSVKEFIKIEAWLLLTFFPFTHTISIHSIVTY